MITDWQDEAACGGDLSFLRRPLEEQLAKCDTCPVANSCRKYGSDYGCDGDIYGGVRITRKFPKINPAILHVTQCGGCGRSITSATPTTRYCNRTCQQLAYERRRAA